METPPYPIIGIIRDGIFRFLIGSMRLLWKLKNHIICHFRHIKNGGGFGGG